MTELKPISIGPVQIASPVILAPMTGVTDLPFRKIVKRYGAGLTVSEMIASQAMIRETRQSLQKALCLDGFVIGFYFCLFCGVFEWRRNPDDVLT